jgi:hypothetical protein
MPIAATIIISIKLKPLSPCLPYRAFFFRLLISICRTRGPLRETRSSNKAIELVFKIPTISRDPLRIAVPETCLTNLMLGTVPRYVKVPGYTGPSYSVLS